MKIVRYLLPKLISGNKKIFISLMLIASFGISVLIAMLNSYEGAKASFSAFFEEYEMADVTLISSELFQDEMINRIEDIDGVESVKGRLCVDREARFGDHYFTLRCFAQEENNGYIIEELEEEPDENVIKVSLPPAFAKISGLKLGDIFTLMVQDKEYECIYAATVSTPECIRMQRNEIFNFCTEEFGYAFLEYEDLKQICNLPDDFYNQLLVQAEDGIDSDELEKRILDSEYAKSVVQSYTYENSPAKIMVDECVEPLKSLCYLVSAIFMLITVVMIYLLVYQIIMEQKEKFGVLMALGGSNREIANIYYAFGGLIAIGAGVIGNVLGYVMIHIIGKAYQSVFYFPEYVVCYSFPLAGLSFVIIIVTVALSLIVATAQIFKMEPSEAMRRQSSSAAVVKGSFLKFLNHVQKVCVCCAIRNKRRTILSFVSTILTVALIVFAFQYSNAGDYMVSHTFTDRFRYDCEVMFQGSVSKDEGKKLIENCDGVEHWELFCTSIVEIKAGDNKTNALLYGIEENSEMIALCTRDNKNVPIEQEGIVLAKHTAEELDVNIGDSITIQGNSVKVTGIHEESLYFLEYCSIEEFNRLVKSGYNGAYITLKNKTTQKDIYTSLKSNENFSYLSMKSSQCKGVEQQISNSETIIPVVVIMGMAIGITIIYNMAMINYKERKRVFAIMMTLGVNSNTIVQANFVELIIQYIVSMIAGTGVGMLAGSFLLKAVSGDSKWYQTEFSFVNILPIAICVGLSMIVGQLLSLRSLKDMDIVEELKAKE